LKTTGSSGLSLTMSAIQQDDVALAAMADIKKHDSMEKRSASSIDDDELDGIHDGLEFPTEEERATLRRVPDKVPWAAYCK